ncbi:hypothetical protein FVO59_11280 [Microbacterium esteraromaticum]|uniref:LGFP repeat-containing protein n=1 Tax=Microbacterium esteraromaticum TaxID=57043 RepID=A0A7D8AMB9_9MICO|nr:hypothetical protein [Microbacterium esteraromaticum]QMU97728.1 hypothetical protein FVO59_11280 [Microbacterium esteraromaticum]
MHSNIPASRRLLSILIVACVALGALVTAPGAAVAASVPGTSTVSTGIAKTADLSTFTPGNLIADSVFFDNSTMNATQIDAFFRSKVKTCRSGYVCLKDYRQNTPNRPADRYCDGYSGAGNESAATIIYRVSLSCGINPRVLIVMLEKEQSLVTHTWPSSWRYDKALGQGCPDTAPCDPAYSGFFYQIYGAARQMQIYAEGRWFTYYAPGKTWNIRYHPNVACGSAPVYVENTATSALYYYTPYQPNRAALNAGYGTGDSCSSYGNRNFFQLFTDWFGDPRNGIAVDGAIAEVWNANGGSGGWMGPPVEAMRTYPGAGWSQAFANADVYVQIGKPATLVTSPVREEYRYVGGVTGGLSWPTTNRVPVAGGGYQDFIGGRMYVRPDGRAFSVSGQTYTTHESVNNISGILGWPKGRAFRSADGWRQDFDSGSVLQNSHTSVPLTSEFVNLHDRLGGYGQFGSATSAVVPDSIGSHVAFTSGWIQKQPSGLIFVKGPLGKTYIQQGGAKGALGHVTAGEQQLPSGVWTQGFAGGAIYDTGRGVYAVSSFAKDLAARGGPDSFGYPSGAEVVDGNRRWQPFGSNSLGRASATAGTYTIKGAIGWYYTTKNGLKSFLKAPVGPEGYIAGGWTQPFEGGTAFYSDWGASASPTSITSVHSKNGGVTGRLGWPTGEASITSTTASQIFSGGGIFVSAAGGFTAKGGLGVEYIRRGAEKSALGWPVGNEEWVAGLWTQRFQNGTLVMNADGSFQVR